MTNLDDFFSDDTDRNVETLVEVTKKFFIFVSQLAEIVDGLQDNFNELSEKVGLISQSGRPVTPVVASSSPPTLSSVPPPSKAPSPVPAKAPLSPPPIPAGSPPTPPPIPAGSPTGLPTPPSPVSPPPAPVNALQAELSSARQSMSPPPSQPSGLPPLPGFGQPSSSPPSPGFGQSPPQSLPGTGGPGAPGPTQPPPRPSPMNLKAQMNLELKEAFARIKKGWDEDG